MHFGNLSRTSSGIYLTFKIYNPMFHFKYMCLSSQKSLETRFEHIKHVTFVGWNKSLSGWWFQPLWKILVRMSSSSPKFRVKIKNIWVATTQLWVQNLFCWFLNDLNVNLPSNWIHSSLEKTTDQTSSGSLSDPWALGSPVSSRWWKHPKEKTLCIYSGIPTGFHGRNPPNGCIKPLKK